MTRAVQVRRVDSAAIGLSGLLSEQKPVLGAFSVAGFPDVPASVEAFLAYAAAGASVLEIGIPSTAPWLDGDTISSAHRWALRGGTGVSLTVETVRRVTAQTGRPVICMAYWATIRDFGPQRFAREIAGAGAAGCLIADIPSQYRTAWAAAARDARLAAPLLVNRRARLPEAAALGDTATGFLYVPAVEGQQTGHTGGVDVNGLASYVDELRRAAPSKPLLTGIGISTPAIAAAVVARCRIDGIVVGSPLVRRMNEQGPARAARLVRDFADSIGAAPRPA